MFNLKAIRNSVLVALWIMVLTFPIMVIRVNTITNTIDWRWGNLLMTGVGSLVVAHVWRYFLHRAPRGARRSTVQNGSATDRPRQPEAIETPAAKRWSSILDRFSTARELAARPAVKRSSYGMLLAFILVFPLFGSLYQTSIMITTLQFIILALGLNIAIGLGGMLHLGYAAFFGIGAYTYALLNINFGIGFWVALPIGAAVAAILGIVLGVSVLRLGGDYLGIVTLGFAEIVRIILENWVGLTNGPRGMPGIDRPSLFGLDLSLAQATDYTYYIAAALTIATIFFVYRLEYSRLGRTWEAMREDDIASEAMGVNVMLAKLQAFALSSVFAGVAGVLFAAKTTFVSPKSFTLLESVTVLLAIVLGGIGSIPGVIVGALFVSLLPEVLREFSQYRMLLFGGILVIMMVFRPGGVVPKRRKAYRFEPERLLDTEGEA